MKKGKEETLKWWYIVKEGIKNYIYIYKNKLIK